MWRRMTRGARSPPERGRPAAVGVSIGGPVDHARVVLSPPNLPGVGPDPARDPAHGPVRCARACRARCEGRAARRVVFRGRPGRAGRNLPHARDGSRVRSAQRRPAAAGCGRRRRRDRALGHGARGPRAYGKAGSLEAFASGAGLPRLAQAMYPGRWAAGQAAEDLVRLARAGDDAAVQVVRRSATWLGRGIAQLVDLLDPEVVVLGALAWRAADLYLPVVRRTVDAEALPRVPAVRIETARLGERLGDVAALVAAIHHGGLAVERGGRRATAPGRPAGGPEACGSGATTTPRTSVAPGGSRWPIPRGGRGRFRRAPPRGPRGRPGHRARQPRARPAGGRAAR